MEVGLASRLALVNVYHVYQVETGHTVALCYDILYYSDLFTSSYTLYLKKLSEMGSYIM